LFIETDCPVTLSKISSKYTKTYKVNASVMLGQFFIFIKLQCLCPTRTCYYHNKNSVCHRISASSTVTYKTVWRHKLGHA